MNKEYNDKVKVKFLELNIYSNANNENTKVIDCFINKNDKQNYNTEDTTYYNNPTKQLEDSIRDEILKVKDENIKVLLLRIHSLFDSADKIYNNMDIRKRYIKEHMNHSIKVFLFDNIEDDFYSLI